ncbi:hypothetical protein PanWU01x14_358890 [Parasponia andersonii]|uniref:Transmembrane protein n=1 Tax=Parasponia andersonii TaxID=3476 RepID=A0A2P5A873_PARAD|nr:hypothetical protein PanWU01x14_358890 [Parasponia andersonii]
MAESVHETTSHDQNTVLTSEDVSSGWLSKEDRDLLNKLKMEENNNSRGAIYSNHRTKIQRVPAIMLRRGNCEEYYKPKVITIVPLHHNNCKSLPEYKLKTKLTAKFVRVSRQTGEWLLQEIKKNTKELKDCFDENEIKTYKDEDLARMLFLDGCTVLEFIHSFLKDELKDIEININGTQATLIQQDLFLLENQIPFRVLNLLMNLSGKKDELMTCIHNFVLMNIMAPASYYLPKFISNIFRLEDGYAPLFFQNQEPVHLLDLLRSQLLNSDDIDGADKDENNSQPRNLSYQYSLNSFLRDSLQPKNPVLRFAYFFLYGSGQSFGNDQMNHLLRVAHFSMSRRSFRNVQDLKAAGIKFKLSNSHCLKAITFTTGFFTTGQLRLPPLIVDDSTACKWWNLVAFEMCPDNHGANFGITSYLSFLDSLIDTEEDVKDLRLAHVLRNRLSSDAEVAELFNKIGSNLVPDHDAYLEVKNKIQRCYERRSSIWMAQVYHDHFRSPWTMLALFAAITALLLTAIQSWYAIHPKK